LIHTALNLKEPDILDKGLFVVNTNWTYDRDAYEDMLTENKAAAYIDRKYGITRITRGCAVCLFHVGVGVIAIGKATDDYRTAMYEDVVDGEYYVPCRFDHK